MWFALRPKQSSQKLDDERNTTKGRRLLKILRVSVFNQAKYKFERLIIFLNIKKITVSTFFCTRYSNNHPIISFCCRFYVFQSHSTSSKYIQLMHDVRTANFINIKEKQLFYNINNVKQPLKMAPSQIYLQFFAWSYHVLMMKCGTLLILWLHYRHSSIGCVARQLQYGPISR